MLLFLGLLHELLEVLYYGVLPRQKHFADTFALVAFELFPRYEHLANLWASLARGLLLVNGLEGGA